MISALGCRDKISRRNEKIYLSDGKMWKPCKFQDNCYTKQFCDDDNDDKQAKDVDGVNTHKIYTLIGQLIISLSVKPGFLHQLFLLVGPNLLTIRRGSLRDASEYLVCFEKEDDLKSHRRRHDEVDGKQAENCVTIKNLQDLREKLSKVLEKQIVSRIFTDSPKDPIVFDVQTVNKQMIYFPSMLKTTAKSIGEDLDKAFKEFGYKPVNSVTELAWISSQMTPTNEELTISSAASHRESIISTDGLLIFLIKRLDNGTYNVEYEEGSESITLSKNALRKFLGDLNIKEISVVPPTTDMAFITYSCDDCYTKDLAFTKNDYKTRCSNDFDVLSSNSKADFEDYKTILFEITAGKWECFDKETLLQYWDQKEQGNAWNYGRCRFVDAKSFDSFGNIVDMPTLLNGDPKRDCSKFYKIPTESRGTYYISQESAERVRDTLGYSKWRLLKSEKVQMGANLHTIGEFNAKDIQVYRLVPVL